MSNVKKTSKNLFLRFAFSRNTTIKLVALSKDDPEIQALNLLLPNSLKLAFRTWAHQWFTLDLGKFNAILDAKVFHSMRCFNGSQVYRDISPLIKLLQAS